MGLALVVFGAIHIATNRLSLTLPLRAPRLGGFISFFLFGATYAGLSVCCAFPLFLVVATGALLAQAPLDGLLVTALYWLDMGSLLFLLSIAVSSSKDYFSDGIRRVVPHVRLPGGALLVVAGAYISYHYWGISY